MRYRSKKGGTQLLLIKTRLMTRRLYLPSLAQYFMQGLGAGSRTAWSHHSFTGLEDTDTSLICHFLVVGGANGRGVSAASKVMAVARKEKLPLFKTPLEVPLSSSLISSAIYY